MPPRADRSPPFSLVPMRLLLELFLKMAAMRLSVQWWNVFSFPHWRAKRKSCLLLTQKVDCRRSCRKNIMRLPYRLMRRKDPPTRSCLPFRSVSGAGPWHWPGGVKKRSGAAGSPAALEDCSSQTIDGNDCWSSPFLFPIEVVPMIVCFVISRKFPGQIRDDNGGGCRDDRRVAGRKGNRSQVQVAFFGGSFTCLPVS